MTETQIQKTQTTGIADPGQRRKGGVMDGAVKIPEK